LANISSKARTSINGMTEMIKLWFTTELTRTRDKFYKTIRQYSINLNLPHLVYK
jgi:hypothetical protein